MINRKDYTGKNNSDYKKVTVLGEHIVENIPFDISAIINNFVKDRPQKNRGINIDIFLIKESFENLIENKLKTKESPISINKIQRSIAKDRISNKCIISFLSYKHQLLGDYEPTHAFLLGINENAFCLISNYRKIDHKKVSKAIYKKLFPYVNRAFLTSNEMRDILLEMTKEGNFDLRMKMDYSKTKDRKKGSLTFYYDHEQRKELPKVENIFNEKLKVRNFMRMLKIVTIDDELEFTFSGEGHIGIYEGIFDLYFNYLILPAINISKKRLKEFTGRSMSDRNNKIALPIKLDFYSSVFDSKEKITQFLRKVGDYKRCYYSILHGGNPYLYMFVIDRYDNSSLSLMSEGDSSLVIIPQIKTSPDSMMRFTQYLLDNFQDGDLITEVPSR